MVTPVGKGTDAKSFDSVKPVGGRGGADCCIGITSSRSSSYTSKNKCIEALI